MAEQTKGQGPQWQEQLRYLPYHERDFDPAVQLVEHPRDADGKVQELDPAGYEPPAPYVMFDRHLADGTHEVERVRVPKKAYDRILRLLDGGQLRAEQLSQLPLRELIPELADHKVAGSASGSGAALFTIPDDYGAEGGE